MVCENGRVPRIEEVEELEEKREKEKEKEGEECSINRLPNDIPSGPSSLIRANPKFLDFQFFALCSHTRLVIGVMTPTTLNPDSYFPMGLCLVPTVYC